MATSASEKIAKSPISSPSNDSSSSSPPSRPPPSNSSSNSFPSPPPSSPSTFSPPSPPSTNQDPSQSPNSTSSSSQVPSSLESSPRGHKNSSEGKSSKSQSNGDDSSSDNGKNSTIFSMPFVLGIIGGILALVIIMIIVACLSRKKKKKSSNGMGYYVDPSIRKANDYYAGGQAKKWGNQDHLVQPHQGLHVPKGGGWNAPPPMMMNSTEISSGGFSAPHAPPLPPPSPTLALGFNKSTFTYEELAAATNGFVQANLLGQGGFGYVHKGVLPNGKEIAVKSLKSGSGQGEREFQAEVDIISRVHHRHLVSLVGYCISGAQRMLVYDFVENKTLEYHLHGKGLPTMDWPTRLKIALGSAKGLAYLHEDCHPRIIHRDIKSANILLDFKFEAMVADFGLAKLSSDNHTHISTRVMGTFGYLAPEYASSGKLTEKSDIFSYGVMLLELITGRRPCDSSHTFMEDSLVDWARPVLSHALSDGNYDELVDPNLIGNYEPMEMARMVACAAAAVRHSARRRPKMSQIVRALDGDVSLEDLNEGMRPGQSMLFSSGSDYESDFYAANMRRNMRKVPIASPEYSDEFNEVSIAEYGHHRAGSSSSDVAFSEELNAIGNQRLRAHSPL